MMKYIFFFAVLLLPPFAIAQISIHQEQSEYYHTLGITAEQYQQLNQPRPMMQQRGGGCTLNKTVFGWHPYWANGLEDNYQWNLISDLCFFSYEVDAATGNAVSTHSFSTNDAVDTALARGVKVHLCVTLFSGHATFFGNAAARTTLINNLVTLIQNRGAHGVNIDFEGVPSSESANLTGFMIDLSTAMHAANPNYKVSICTYAVDWNNVFNETALAPYVDFITIMGYDYYWSGSTEAGPCDPLYGFSTSYDRSLSRTVTYYRDQGMPASKIVLGIPYYGREWETVSGAIPSNTTGSNVFSRTYGYVKDNTSGFYINPQNNSQSISKAYVFQNAGTWRQCWITEEYEMKRRYDLVNQRGLKGIGIWALGYDDGYTGLWNAIEEKFTDCAVVLCSDTIYDGGGPLVDYYDREDYSFTISPDGATQVTLDFQSFITEVNYDTLWLYDGPSVNAPLIGFYHGTNSPGSVTSSGSSITLRFKSDGATRQDGWMAVWNCIQDNQPPSTQINIPNGWITQDFPVAFIDNDDLAVQYSFFNVAGYDGAEWRSNPTHGFFYDEFDIAVHPDWSANLGIWNSIAGDLVQSDDANNNTNIYAYLNQDTADAFVYEWKGTTTGSGSNRRSGFHFFSDEGWLDNRGDSYFVWFRVDNSTLQFYKTINDAFSLQHEVPFTTVAGQEYFYRVVYSKVTGTIEVYVDGTFVGSWTDPAPYQTGEYISFRSGNSQYAVDDLHVYRLRGNNETITLGDSTKMLRYQNPDPLTPAGRILSLVTDPSHHFSPVSDSLLNIDWTPPVTGAYIHDGFSADEDTLSAPSYYGANWGSFSDPNSELLQNYYAIGNIAGSDDVLPWTNNALWDTCSFSTSGMINGVTYYISVYAENNAGLISDTLTSDGFEFTTGVNGLDELTGQIRVYPNPATDAVQIIFAETGEQLYIYDAAGKPVFCIQINISPFILPLHGFADGLYLLRYAGQSIRIIKSGH